MSDYSDRTRQNAKTRRRQGSGKFSIALLFLGVSPTHSRQLPVEQPERNAKRSAQLWAERSGQLAADSRPSGLVELPHVCLRQQVRRHPRGAGRRVVVNAGRSGRRLHRHAANAGRGGSRSDGIGRRSIRGGHGGSAVGRRATIRRTAASTRFRVRGPADQCRRCESQSKCLHHRDILRLTESDRSQAGSTSSRCAPTRLAKVETPAMRNQPFLLTHSVYDRQRRNTVPDAVKSA